MFSHSKQTKKLEPTLEMSVREAQSVLEEARRWKNFFGEAHTPELVDACVLQIRALESKYLYLRRLAQTEPAHRKRIRRVFGHAHIPSSH